ncbi:MAG TPA: response regulator, partial [Methylomirabilota bacterium]|nr:response regulator [Methylomirabilota bacterium]
MSIAAVVAPQLPYLRRYARALSGRQDAGDHYVVAVLETLVADPSSLPTDCDPKVGIYSVFSRIWNSVPVNAHPTESPSAIADQRLGAITPLPRQAFLLTAVEGFTSHDAARVLGVSEDEFADLVNDAGQQIGEQVATEVLIIEDEPIIAMDLEDLVTSIGHTVIGNARTHTEAVAMVNSHRPGLVLADIQLADGSSGLDAVNEMLQAFSVPVVFITAYPERLLTGERPEPTFLITKPFRNDTVKA